MRTQHSTDPRDLALTEVQSNPGIQAREAASRLGQRTGLADSTVIRLLRSMEREGLLQGGLDGRRKAYWPTDGTNGHIVDVVEDLAPARPAPPWGVTADPASIPTKRAATKRGTPGQLLAVVGAVLAIAAALMLAFGRDKDALYADHSISHLKDQTPAAPAPAPRQPAPVAQTPAPKPATKKRPAAPAPAGSALAAAKRLPTAVLSGSPAPGIASRIAGKLKHRGFRVGTVGNASGPLDRSIVLYARGSRRPARALARSLHIRSVRRVGRDNAAIAPGAKLFVVVGTHR